MTTWAGFVLVIGSGTAGAEVTEAGSDVSVVEEDRSHPSTAANEKPTAKHKAVLIDRARWFFFMLLSLPYRTQTARFGRDVEPTPLAYPKSL